MGKQICTQNTAPSSLAMHKINSQTISKVKSKIRIIHIFAPEIIKTDAANFRELVQRLTGKPTDDKNCTKKKSRIVPSDKEPRNFPSNKKMEQAMRAGFQAASEGFGERIKDEEEIWRDANTGGGFLGGFAEFDHGFMQELNQFPFMEGTTQMDVYEESQVA
ncbi:hypothetical protein Pfo_003086 [Paulownia fortunei]|nr:hypothetical protein Pfo_003086 [Paulownia fortunei]